MAAIDRADHEDPARIESFESVSGQYYFHFVAKNGEIVLHSEAYAYVRGLEGGVESVLENAARAPGFEMREARDGDWYFVVKAENDKVIATSETYVSRSNAERGMNTAKGLIRDLAGKRAVPAPVGAKFEMFTGEDDLVYFHLRAKNGEAVLSSQGYQSLHGAKNGVDSVKENGVIEAKFELIEARDGAFYLRLKAANGEIIARSEVYASEANATRARNAVIDLLANGNVR